MRGKYPAGRFKEDHKVSTLASDAEFPVSGTLKILLQRLG